MNFICACSRENLFAAIFITQRAAAAAVPVAIDLPKCQAERERGLLFCVQSLDVGVHLIPLLTDCQMTRNSSVHCAVIFIYLFLFLVCLFVCLFDQIQFTSDRECAAYRRNRTIRVPETTSTVFVTFPLRAKELWTEATPSSPASTRDPTPVSTRRSQCKAHFHSINQSLTHQR